MSDVTFVKRKISVEVEVPSDARFLTVGEDGSVRVFSCEPTQSFADWKPSKAGTELQAVVVGWRETLIAIEPEVKVYPPAELVA